MPAALGLPAVGATALPELLRQEGGNAAWVALLGPLPAGEALAWISAVADGVPLLVLEPNPQQRDWIEQELEAAELPLPSLVSELLAAEAGEQCWYCYNDSRYSGTTPPEVLQPHRPNLQLESLELRSALPLASVLDRWREQEPAPGATRPEGAGLLVLPAAAAPVLLAGAGRWLEQLGAVLLHGATAEVDPGLAAQLAAACLSPEITTSDLQLWRLSPMLRLEKQLQDLTRERDQLVGERDQLHQAQAALQAERDTQGVHLQELTRERDQLVGERDQLVVEGDQLRQAQAALQAERDTQGVHLQELTRERDQLVGERNQLVVEGDQLRQAQAALQAERDTQGVQLQELTRERDQLVGERDQLVVEGDQLRQVQAALQAERDTQGVHLQELTRERDQLVGERDQLVGQKAELDQRLELINRELDEILLLLDSAEMAPPAAGAPSEPQAS